MQCGGRVPYAADRPSPAASAALVLEAFFFFKCLSSIFFSPGVIKTFISDRYMCLHVPRDLCIYVSTCAPRPLYTVYVYVCPENVVYMCLHVPRERCICVYMCSENVAIVSTCTQKTLHTYFNM